MAGALDIDYDGLLLSRDARSYGVRLARRIIGEKGERPLTLADVASLAGMAYDHGQGRFELALATEEPPLSEAAERAAFEDFVGTVLSPGNEHSLVRHPSGRYGFDKTHWAWLSWLRSATGGGWRT